MASAPAATLKPLHSAPWRCAAASQSGRTAVPQARRAAAGLGSVLHVSRRLAVSGQRAAARCTPLRSVTSCTISPPRDVSASPTGGSSSGADLLHASNGADQNGSSAQAAPFDPLSREFLLGQLKGEGWTIALIFVALFFCTACTTVTPLLSSAFFESLLGRLPADQFYKSVALLTCCYVFEALATLVYVRTIFKLSERAFEKIRVETFRALLVQRVQFFDRFKANELAALVSAELSAIRSVLADNTGRDRGLRALSEVLATVGILAALSRELTPVLAVLIVAVSTTATLFTRSCVAAFGKDVATQARLTEASGTAFANIRTVRSFGAEGTALRGFAGMANAARESGLGIGKVKSMLECANRGAISVSLFTLYAYGGWLCREGYVPVGTLLASVGYTFFLIFGCTGMVNTYLDFKKAQGAVVRLRQLIASGEPEPSFLRAFPAGAGTRLVEQGPDSLATLDTSAVRAAALAGDVDLQGVSFEYPGRVGAAVLRGVSLRLPRGKTTALVGRSGAGKTTISQLLARFYEPTAGQILLGGVPVSSFSAAEWAGAIAYVPQEPILFAGQTIADNIAYGVPGATRQQVEAAAAAANAAEFIEKLAQGYDTVVAANSLSGGQRQRVCIARAILKDAPILILDEATSALDAVSEAKVQAALGRLAVGRTVLVIAHRLSTVKSADQIAVLSEGQVVELGTHDSLLANPGGFYSQLVSAQESVTMLTL